MRCTTLGRIKGDRHRTSVLDINSHRCAKNTRLDAQTTVHSERIHKFIEHRLRLLSPGSIGKAGATTFASRRVQRELAHQQQSAIDVHHRLIESRIAGLVREYTHIQRLVDDVPNVFPSVFVSDPNKKAETKLDRTGHLTNDGY